MGLCFAKSATQVHSSTWTPAYTSLTLVPQVDYVLAEDGGVGLVDAATWALSEWLNAASFIQCKGAESPGYGGNQDEARDTTLPDGKVT